MREPGDTRAGTACAALTCTDAVTLRNGCIQKAASVVEAALYNTDKLLQRVIDD